MRRALLCCALLVSFSLGALEVPPAPTQWVTDRAGILGPTEVDLLNRKLADFEQSTGAQFIVYILPTLEGDPVEDFSIRAVERWKVGQKKYDNGLVLFVFVQEKKVRVEVGYGLEGTITDAVASRVIREQIGPAFAQGQYARGLNAGADELMARIRKGEAPVPPLQQRDGQAQTEEEVPDVLLALAVLICVFFFILPMFARRRSGCGGCIFPMFFFPGGGVTFSGGGFGGGGFGGGGGFSGGGGGFGGGGATGGW